MHHAINSSPKDILDRVAETLVARQRFSTVEEAIWEFALVLGCSE